MPAKAGLVGFYSTTTADDYINQPRPSFGRKKKSNNPQSDAGNPGRTHKNDNRRGASMLDHQDRLSQGQDDPVSTPDDSLTHGRRNTSSAIKKPRRKGSLLQWIQRRKMSSAS